MTWRNYSRRRASRSRCSSPRPLTDVLNAPVPPRMIPSRTVFNHCKWIYIELAITSAHSGMGPLCISSAPDTSRQSPGERFPHFIPPCHRLQQPLDSRNRLSFPTPAPLVRSTFLSCSLFRSFRFPSLKRVAIFLPLIAASRSRRSSSFRASLPFLPHHLTASVCLSFLCFFPSFSVLLEILSFFPTWLFSSSLGFHVSFSLTLIPLRVLSSLFDFFFFLQFLLFRLSLCFSLLTSHPFKSEPLVASVLVSRKRQGDALFHLTVTYPIERWKEIQVDFSMVVLQRPRNCPTFSSNTGLSNAHRMSNVQIEAQVSIDETMGKYKNYLIRLYPYDTFD